MILEKRSRRQDRYRPSEPENASSNLALYKRHLEHFWVLNRAMAEVAALTEKLAMIRRNGDECILGHEVKKLLHHSVQISDGVNLTFAKLPEFTRIESFGLRFR